MKRVLSGIALIALLVLVMGTATPSFAGPLAPGTTVPALPETGTFTTITDTGLQSFNNGLGLFGTAEEWVGHFSGNPYGGLTFVYQFTLGTGSYIAERFTASSFAKWMVDVGVNAALVGAVGTVGPSTASRSLAPGKVVSFSFVPIAVMPGQTTFDLIINTNAPSYAGGTFSIQDGTSASLKGFAPAVPEPASLGLLGTGLLALAGGLRKKLFS